MLKKYRIHAIISSLAIFLPCIFGLIMWDKLPLTLTTHFGADGVADGTGSKAFAVFGIPAILFVLHWVCVLVTLWDWKKRGEQSGKVFALVLWICPYASLLVSVILYSVALGYEISLSALTVLPIGLLFAVIGNYMPKVKRNHTMGVKVKWALENDENWYATHRVAGKVWTIGGLLLTIAAFIPGKITLIICGIALIPIIFVPAIYSYIFYRKQLKEGSIEPSLPTKGSKAGFIISVVMSILIGVAVIILLFTGDINVELGEDAFTVKASYYEDITVDYEDIDSIELREKDDVGSRVAGFGSPRLMMGNFKNDEFGMYARYSYTSCDWAIVLREGENVLVLSGKDEDSTKALFESLKTKID